MPKENIASIERLKTKIKNDIKATKKKLKVNVALSLFVSFFTMLINLVILGLAIWALTELIIKIIDKQFEPITVVMPTIVSVFIIASFIFTLLTAIYKVKSRIFFYQDIVEDYQYLIIKINDQTIDYDEAVIALKEINDRSLEYKKLSNKKLMKKVLGG